MKRLICFFLTVFFLLSVIITAFSSISCVAADSSFSGNRCSVFTFDKSDIENFVSGGRSSLDILIRTQSPAWIEASLTAKNRDILITLSFDFESLEDYENKIEYLCGSPQAVVCEKNDGLVFFECFGADMLLQLYTSKLIAAGSMEERQFSDIIESVDTTLTVYGDTYRSDELYFSVKPNGMKSFRFSELSVETDWQTPGKYVRTITATIDTKSEENSKVDSVNEQFKKIGEVQRDGESGLVRLTLTIEGNSENDIIYKTVSALGVANGITEKQKYLDEETVKVSRTEFMNVSRLILNAESFYTYSKFPEKCQLLSNDDESIQIDEAENSVKTAGVSDITVTYKRGIRFSKLIVETDLSHVFGKAVRHIRLYMPLELAADYHDVIKETLEKRMNKGVILEIYDDNACRIYDFSYSSWFQKEFVDVTKKVLSAKYRFDVKKTILPYGKMSYTEKLECDEILPGAEPLTDIEYVYILPSGASVSEKDDIDGNRIIVKPDDSGSITVSWLQIRPLLCAVWIIILVILLILIFTVKKVCKSIKERIVKKNQEKEFTKAFKQSKKSQTRTCPNCGAPQKGNSAYCGSCGAKLE